MSRDPGLPALSDNDRGRLHWTMNVGAERHLIDILPDAYRSGISIDVDGRTVLRMRKPTEPRPRVEGSFDVAGTEVVIALEWNGPIMRTNVYIDGVSLLDGGHIETDRAAAPRPVRGYDLWFRPPVRGPIDPPLMSPLLAALAAVSGLVVFIVPVPILLPRLVGALYLAGLWFWTWYVLTARTNAYLLRRPELGDLRRVLAMGAVFLGYPALGLVIFLAASLVTSR